MKKLIFCLLFLILVLLNVYQLIDNLQTKRLYNDALLQAYEIMINQQNKIDILELENIQLREALKATGMFKVPDKQEVGI